MIRVLIADNYPVVRCGLKQILNEATDIHVVDEATTCVEILNKVRSTYYQLVVLDGFMLDGVGVDLLADLRQVNPSLRVLLFSMQTNKELGVRSLKAGASGYVTINSTMDELINAVRVVADGRKYICPDMAETLANGSHDSDEPRHRVLSDREFQVMRLLGAGKTPTETARTLGLGKTTIATYRTRILDKLNLQNSAEIVRYAVEHQLAY